MSKIDKLDKAQRREKLIKDYAEIVSTTELYPSHTDLKKFGWDRDRVRRAIGTLKTLRAEAKLNYPDCFEHIIDESHFTSTEHTHVLKEISKHRKFVITTAISGSPANKPFLKSLRQYCKIQKALLLVIPSFLGANETGVDYNLDSEFLNDILVFNPVALNNNIGVFPLKIRADQINPLTGIKRFGKNQGTLVLNSPKQSLEYIATKVNKLPHAVMTTGAATLCNYKQPVGPRDKKSVLAENDHTFGAIVVELEDKELYHFRQLTSMDGIGFADLGKYYDGSRVQKLVPRIVFGDWHAGSTDQDVKAATIKLIQQLDIKQGYFHDLWDGMSTNHHERGKKITLAKKHTDLSIENEGRIVAGELMDMGKVLSHMYIIESNHNEFLIRYLQDGRFFEEPHNYKTGLELSLAALDGQNPVQVMTERYLDKATRNKTHWLRRDAEHMFGGLDLSVHGDKGPNGSFGNKANLEDAYGEAIIGHSHTPGILRRIFQVGTKSVMDLDYKVGPSSWMHTDALVYSNGQVQLVNYFGGKFCL